MRGYDPGRFSFNVKGGRCEACAGDGVIRIEMHFLPDVYVTCEVCHGTRYNRETLEVRYKGKSIADVLDMTVGQALEFLGNVPPIRQKLETLASVGLDYIRLGQSATTLSGGEAQRIKLAKELSRRATGRTLYILDEPTTGLHFDDINRLLDVLDRLVDAGNTVIVIEHNLDVIKTADHVIDLGPEGGAGGGAIVAHRHARGRRRDARARTPARTCARCCTASRRSVRARPPCARRRCPHRGSPAKHPETQQPYIHGRGPCWFDVRARPGLGVRRRMAWRTRVRSVHWPARPGPLASAVSTPSTSTTTPPRRSIRACWRRCCRTSASASATRRAAATRSAGRRRRRSSRRAARSRR